jgi:hypothetical protein
MSLFSHKITLTPEEKIKLQKIVGSSNETADKILRANILLMSDSGCEEQLSDKALADKLQTTTSIIKFVRRTLLSRGIEQALQRDPNTPTNSRGFYF